MKTGCSRFWFFERNGDNFLRQFSENPLVYTKIHCFLPWIAAQYNMDYTPPEATDPDCLTGNGDITQVTARQCRTNPSNNAWDRRERIEAPCLFPCHSEREKLQ